nr:defensin [Lilium regale]
MAKLPTILLLLFLVMATEMGTTTVEARTCLSQSHKFKGTCLRAANCASVCQTEGFKGGVCEGIRRRCFCEADCH